MIEVDFMEVVFFISRDLNLAFNPTIVVLVPTC